MFTLNTYKHTYLKTTINRKKINIVAFTSLKSWVKIHTMKLETSSYSKKSTICQVSLLMPDKQIYLIF